MILEQKAHLQRTQKVLHFTKKKAYVIKWKNFIISMYDNISITWFGFQPWKRSVNKLPLSSYESKAIEREREKYNFCLSSEHKLMFFNHFFLFPPSPPNPTYTINFFMCSACLWIYGDGGVGRKWLRLKHNFINLSCFKVMLDNKFFFSFDWRISWMPFAFFRRNP